MLRLVSLSVLVPIATITTPADSLTSASAICMPSDKLAQVGTEMLKRIVTSTDPQTVRTRTSWGLPSVAASQVSYVTDNATCNSAEAAYTPAVTPTAPGVAPSGKVRVWKVGTTYMVHDTAQARGDLYVAMTLSKQFKVVSKYLY